MKTDDMILISVDDHIIEPPDLFVNHMPKENRARAPHLGRTPEGADVWEFSGFRLENSALNAIAGRPKEEFGLEPQGLDEIRPGCYDIHERVKDMAAAGILAGMNFPSFPGFAARLFVTDDSEFSQALVRAYNDWHIDEWCAAYPGRMIPQALPMIWDAQLCADEVRRVSKKGCHSLSFTENPVTLGYPSFHSDYWNPLWQALCDTNTVLSIHLGSSGKLSIPSPDGPPNVMMTLQPQNMVSCAADLLWSPILRNYPDLKIALSEGSTGWIPYFLERADRVYKVHGYWTMQDFGGRLPSEVFKEHFLTCFISDDLGIDLRHRIGVDNVAWECDFPHSDSTWPTPGEQLNEQFQLYDVPDAEIDKITHQNAMKWYSFDPFAHIPREQCTIGALRASVADHDISVVSRSHRIVAPNEKIEHFRQRAAGIAAPHVAR